MCWDGHVCQYVCKRESVLVQSASKFTKDTEATEMETKALKVAKKSAKKQAKASVPAVYKVNVRKMR